MDEDHIRAIDPKTAGGRAAHMLRGMHRLAQHYAVVDGKVRIDFDALYEPSFYNTLSDGEKRVCDVALVFWNGHGDAMLADVLNWFDNANLERFMDCIEGMCQDRGIVRVA